MTRRVAAPDWGTGALPFMWLLNVFERSCQSVSDKHPQIDGHRSDRHKQMLSWADGFLLLSANPLVGLSAKNIPGIRLHLTVSPGLRWWYSPFCCFLMDPFCSASVRLSSDSSNRYYHALKGKHPPVGGRGDKNAWNIFCEQSIIWRTNRNVCNVM